MENNKIRIILADDNIHLRKFVKEKILSNSEFEIIAETDDGDEELEMIVEMKPDIVITDLKRDTGISGLEVIKKCYNLGIKDVDFLVTTGGYYKESFFELQEMGVSYILRKPFELDTLIKEIYRIKEDKVGKLLDIKNESKIDKSRNIFSKIFELITSNINR